MGDNTEKPQGEGKLELIAEYKQCPVCAVRQIINSLIDLIRDYTLGQPSNLPENVVQANTSKFLEMLDKLQKDMDIPNHLGITRFADHIAEEVREKGWMDKEYNYYLHMIKAPVRQPEKESLIPYGSTTPGYIVGMDVCEECGTKWAVRLYRATAVKTLPPQPKGRPGFPPG